MRTIPLELQEETAQEVFMVQHLITITTATSIYRWTDGQGSVYWNGHWWVPKGITFDTLGSTLTGQLDSLTLEIDNADLAFSDSVLSETDIKAGNECVLEIVYLDNNLTVRGEPAVLIQGFVDRISMDRGKARVEVFSHMIRWKLATPRRQHTPSCPWVFQSAEGCHYDGNVYRNPTSDILAGFTRSHLASNYLNVDDRLDDLCVGQTVTASSNDGAGHVVANAFDRDVATYWKSTNAAPPHWVKIQFAVAKIFTKCRIYNNTAAFSPVDFLIKGSNDDAAWVTLDSRNGVSWGTETFKDFEFSNTTAYLYYMIYVNKNTASGNYTSFKEVEFYGPSDQVNDSDYNHTSATGSNYTSQYPTQDDDHVKATTKWDATFWPYFSTDPAKSLTGAWNNNSWLAGGGVTANQRFHIDLGTAKIIKRVYYENGHTSGTVTNAGVKNFTIWGSNTAGDFADLTYANDGTWVPITPAQTTFDQHAAADAADPKYITLTNSTAYRYYAFKFADNWGGTYLVVRRIELQTDTSTTPSVSDIFGISAIALSAGVTGIVVTVRVRAKQVTASARTLAGRIKYNGVYYTASAITPATSYTDYDFIWLTNPETSAAWAVADMALLQGCGYGVFYDAGTHEVDVSECYLKVSNTITGLSCNLSPERCLALNNRDNFGGFVYISELQTKEFWWGSKQKTWGGGI